MHKRYTWGTVFAATLFAVLPTFAHTSDAQELNAPDVRGSQRKVAANEVTLNGKTLFVVPVGTGNLSAAERADIIRERLEEIAAHYVVADNAVTVVQSGNDTFVVAVAGETVATVEPSLARAAGAKNAATLAQAWADSVRVSLSKPVARVAAR